MRFWDAFRSKLLYCGLSRDSFTLIYPQMVQRNLYTFNFTSVAITVFGLVYLILQLVTAPSGRVPYPYILLVAGGVAAVALRRSLTRAKPAAVMGACYGLILLVCLYAILLAMQPHNRTGPATSIIVFMTVMPLTVSDRPLKMCIVILVTAAAFLTCSFLLSPRDVFYVDFLNAFAFAMVGMFLYTIISNRTVNELYEGERVRQLQSNIIGDLSTVIEERDEGTGDHIHSITSYVRRIIDGMREDPRYAQCTDDFFENVILTSPMHDIGKIRIPDQILNKPGKLTPEEFEIIKRHARYGEEIMDRFDKTVGATYYDVARNIAGHHHERWDGTGYPDGLKGEDIPLEARIVALADVYDALVSRRVYKDAYPKEKALAILADGRGTQFDPALTDVFLRVMRGDPRG